MNSILIIAHSPFAQALRQCALHVFPDCEQAVVALDVLPNVSPEETLAAARITLQQQLHAPRSQVLVLADVFGATPCNVAQKLVDGVHSKLVAGVNLPMLLRAVTYRHEPLDTLVQRAIAGGTAGVMQVAVAAPQNQAKRKHSDQEIRDHQQ
ncbi:MULTISPECIES: PTS sugar transporter subunit IIA [Variovorax]|jgi:PTS system mannose-specific IIA component|uniref:PTS fructose transporter subunit IIA n=1 Tax=Variovorax paradoxus TaxID=34073 RepID=A0A0D0MMB4_VARPD|nr:MULTISPECIES: PTS fructose transporter subunit IIA [Variovorax]KIQ33396.1 PTS fructose transporter subunit IIA [Variovorax paradoxus]MBJ2160156.1 PTS fructose transporter subunit IIA [Variovorax sp. IB41]MCR6480114.1 PTS fructose transporter subunit IIA [Variovorax sp. ZS18.2.2]QSI33750.1 PTS fructose transporter subunit IIA [Variovorax sp. RKNM96]SFQ41791.1 PTS system, ascorbate-specific IIA component [Variovorax sp. 770b2]